jgi:uncharacterized protein with HEPN domain
MACKVGHALHDILTAIDRIERITRGKTLADVESSWELCWLIGRGIEIISEASRAIPDDVKNTRPEIAWRKVASIGNVLRHEYDGLSESIIWGVVVDELPKLRTAIESIAASLKE